MDHLGRLDDQECTCGDPECQDCYPMPPLSSEVRFRAKVNDRVPAHELYAWADKIEKLEKR